MPKKVLLPALFLISVQLFAWNADNTASVQGSDRFGFSLTPVSAVVYGHSDELVFGSASGEYPYVSQLHWKIQPAWILGVEGSVNFDDRFLFNIAMGKALNRGTGNMTDRDWISDYFNYSENEWTHESVSTITLNKSFFLDASGAWRFYKRRSYSLDLKAGFKLLRWGWTDRITSVDYTYVSSTYPWNDLTPEEQDALVGQNGIDYVVNYKIPYLGIRGQGRWGALTAGISLGFSFLVFTDDHDFHKLRNIHFYDKTSFGQYLGVSSSVGLQILQNLSASLAYDFEWVPENRGSIMEYTDGILTGYSPDGAGVEYLAHSLRLMISLNF